MRQLDAHVLQELFTLKRKDIAWLAYKSGVSFSLLEKMRAGHYGEPKQSTIDKICRALKVNEFDLFPIKRGGQQ